MNLYQLFICSTGSGWLHFDICIILGSTLVNNSNKKSPLSEYLFYVVKYCIEYLHVLNFVFILKKWLIKELWMFIQEIYK